MSSSSHPGQKGKKGKANPAQIAKVLKGIDYPKSKKEIVDYAQRHNVDKDPNIIKVLEHLPEKEYGSMADLEQSFGQAG